MIQCISNWFIRIIKSSFQIYSKDEKCVLLHYPTIEDVPNIIRSHHNPEHCGINQTTEWNE